MRGEASGCTRGFAATFCDFFQFPNIDAAVLEVEDKGRLLLNPFSPRKSDVTRTRFYSFFADTGGSLDIDDILPPKAFILRGDVDRSDEDAVRKALCDQYPGYQFILFDMKSWGLIVKVELPKISS